MLIGAPSAQSHYDKTVQTVQLAALLKDFGVQGIRIPVGIDNFQNSDGNVDHLIQVGELAATLGVRVSPTLNMNGKVFNGTFPTCPVTKSQIDWNVKFWVMAISGLFHTGVEMWPIEWQNEPGANQKIAMPNFIKGTIDPRQLEAIHNIASQVDFLGIPTLYNFTGDSSQVIVAGVQMRAYQHEANCFVGPHAEWIGHTVSMFSTNCYMAVPRTPYNSATNVHDYITKYNAARFAYRGNSNVGTAKPFVNREFGMDIVRTPSGHKANECRRDAVVAMRRLGIDCGLFSPFAVPNSLGFEVYHEDGTPIDGIDPIKTAGW